MFFVRIKPSYIKTIIPILLKRRSLTLFFIFVSLVTLHTPIEVVLTSAFVNPILSHIESIWYNDFFFIITVFVVVIMIVQSFQQHRPSENNIYLTTLLSIFYCFYRTKSDVWEFTSTQVLPYIKYADLTLLITAGYWTVWIAWFFRSERKQSSEESFLVDDSIGKLGSDELGYSAYASLLANKIKSGTFKKSMAIGINGQWGIGKTSFFDLLKRNLNGKNLIEVNFNPWKSSSPQSIIGDFFETLEESIQIYHSSISNLLVRYANKLNTAESLFGRSIELLTQSIGGYKSVNSTFEEINESIEKIGKKLIIYIDDLDRLNKDEILEVLKLIRNTANFHNTFFIVSYDRNYIISALREHNSFGPYKFLEKIFQIEINLPAFNKLLLRKKFAETLKNSFQDFKDLIDKEILGTSYPAPIFLDEWLQTMRDVTRLTNSIKLNWRNLLEEINFSDLLKLEVLRLNFPSIHNLLFTSTSKFLEAKQHGNNRFAYQLKDSEKKTTTELQKYVCENTNELSIHPSEITKMLGLVSSIFSNNFLSYKRSHLSVVYPSKFQRYFSYGLERGNLSEVAFSKARASSLSEFKQAIANWSGLGLKTELEERFSLIESFDDQADFENVIQGMFHFERIHLDKILAKSNSFIYFNQNDLVGKLNNYDGNIENKFYSEPEGKSRYQKFISSLFESATSPFLFESDLARSISVHFSEDFGLPKDYFHKRLVIYFGEYAKSNTKLDTVAWQLYHNCKRGERTSLGNSTYQTHEITFDEAKQIMNDLILKDLDQFLLDITHSHLSEKRLYGITSDFIFAQFGDWHKFKKLIFDQDDSKWQYLKEFKDFFIKFEEKGFKQYISFTFNSLPIDEKQKSNLK